MMLDIPVHLKEIDFTDRFFQKGKTLSRIGAGIHQIRKDSLLPPRAQHLKNRFPYFSTVYVLQGEAEFLSPSGVVTKLSPGFSFYRYPGLDYQWQITSDETWIEAYVSCLSWEINSKATSLTGVEGGDPLVFDNERASGSYDLFLSMLNGLGVIDLDKFYFYPSINIRLIEDIKQLINNLRRAEVRMLPSLYLEASYLISKILRDVKKSEQINEKDYEMIKIHLINDPTDRTPLPQLIDMLDLKTSYSMLRKMFNENMNMSINDFRINCRIDLACKLLFSGSSSIQEISQHLGYTDTFTFSKQFKKIKGVSPKKYQAMN